MLRSGSSFWVIALISAFIVFLNLGGIPLLDPDEPVYAETPKEMFQFNEFISPRIYGEYWYDKPPMYYWLVAGAYKLFGINEFAARFPSALLAVICVLIVYKSGRRLFNNSAGMASALVLATSIEYFYLGKAAVTDITLTLFLTLSLLSFIEKRYYLFYIFAGLATVTKGPIGLLFPGAIVFVYLAATRNFTELKNMKIVSGLILYSIVAVPWYWIMYQLHGGVFFDTFLGFHNITRFTSPEHPEGVLWYYYIPVLILGFFPWTALMVQAVWNSLRNSRQDFSVLVFLNIWAAFIFIFFTISRTKLVSYILPMYPPLAMIVGWYIDRILLGVHSQSSETTARESGETKAAVSNESVVSRRFSWSAVLLILSALFAGGMLKGLEFMPALQDGVFISAGIIMAMALAVGYLIWKNEVIKAFWVQIGSMVLFAAVLVTMLFPKIADDFASKDIAREFTLNYDGKSPVYVTKFLRPGFAFYSDTYGIELKSDDDLGKVVATGFRAYFVIRKSEYEHLGEKEQQNLTILAEKADKILLLKK